MRQNPLDILYQDHPLVFGHRGASAYAPMNTLPGFELAVHQGADGVELDVHFSKDRELVVIHDFTVDGTTNGHGRVSDSTLAQLRELDAGSWFGGAFKGVQIPTLDEVFEAVGTKLFINVEIKVEASYSDGLEQAVADKVAQFGLQQGVLVSSFDLPALERFRQIAPGVPVGFLHSSLPGEEQRSRLRDLHFEAVHPQHTLIDSAYMGWAKGSGYRVNTWTVNDPMRAAHLRDQEVDGIISDCPDVILRALGR
jgi:glycerophosphoryl diester phosphodiesterase